MSSHEEINISSDSSCNQASYSHGSLYPYTPIKGQTPMIPIHPPPKTGGKGLRILSPKAKTGYSPQSKKMRSSVEFKGTLTQSDDFRIECIQHYQHESIGLQKEMAWEQRRQGEQIGFITRQLMKFCGHSPTKNTIRSQPSSPVRPCYSPVKLEPNSWDKQLQNESEPSEN